MRPRRSPSRRTRRAHDHFPLNRGAKWVYKVGDSEVTAVVAAPERVKDEDWVRVETLVGKEPRVVECYAVRTDGVYRTKVKEDALEPAVRVLPATPKAGDSWVVDSKFGAQRISGTLAVKSDRAPVKVPAGEFDAVFVESTNFDIAGAKAAFRFWYARGVGLVKQEVVLPSGDKVALELAKFEPGELPPPPPTPTVAAVPVCAVALCAVAPPCRIVARCSSPVIVQECCGCRTRSVFCWVRRW